MLSKRIVEESFDTTDPVIPRGLECPITRVLMQNPVIAADGHSYEEKAIREWFNRGNNKSPVTGLPLPNQHLVPNINLKQVIDEYKEKFPLVSQYILDQKSLLERIRAKEAANLENKETEGKQNPASSTGSYPAFFLEESKQNNQNTSQTSPGNQNESNLSGGKCSIL